ncbi:hypothetical protein GCM10023081_46790 [Arthrobacter ginkgonis]|uniref:Uncharacterized protein n=1 Tax=Arthrobacter ginkgonis TaxID=1630594 RepID=A0ABP7DJS2_9MICC
MTIVYGAPGAYPTELDDFYVHTVTVHTLTSQGAWGDDYTPTAGVKCFIDDTRTLVRDGQGAEVISETNLTAPPYYASLFKPGSTVDLPSRTATVIKAGLADSGPLELPDHIEVWLT